ncbi:MAG: Nramp family divalent metal transporter [Elusimicrobia bacterium]|nr:Nramp family divalent metal transporter [Elusimicrobiota bacterium]
MKLGELSQGSPFWNRVKIFLVVMGPGIITANVDNDAGGITTYTLAGAHFGNQFLWTMIPITLLLILVQEIVARMGVVTGKGLADLIRENFGVKITFYLMVGLIGTNLGNVVAEFAGIAASLGLFGVPKVLSVSCSALFVWWLVTQGDYKRVEKVFLVACLFYFTYIFSGWYSKPDWNATLRDTFTPLIKTDRESLTMLVALIGTTIAPWMQFYQQAAMVDKGLQARDYKYARLDVVAGCIMTNVVAFFIVVACSTTLFKAGIRVEEATQAAMALKPLAGEGSSLLFAFGLFNASIFAASILPLSTAYSVCEGMGWQTGVDRSFEEAPQFYGLYTLMIAAGAVAVCWPGFPLIRVMYWSQVLNGLLLPAVLALCVELSSREDLMGAYVNPRWFRWTAWTCVAGVSTLSMTMVFRLVF